VWRGLLHLTELKKTAGKACAGFILRKRGKVKKNGGGNPEVKKPLFAMGGKKSIFQMGRKASEGGKLSGTFTGGEKTGGGCSQRGSS